MNTPTPTPTPTSSMRPGARAAVAALGLVALGAVGAYGALSVANRDAPRTLSSEAITTAAPMASNKPAAPAQKPRAARCTNCGVVESVQAVQVKGEGTGLGAAAGGIVGGVVGHQMGGGRGKDAMTVIGAIGGGIAGHEIEKQQRASTQYQVKVRMADGSVRTLTQSQAPAVGQQVRVEGESLRVVQG